MDIGTLKDNFDKVNEAENKIVLARQEWRESKDLFINNINLYIKETLGERVINVKDRLGKDLDVNNQRIGTLRAEKETSTSSESIYIAFYPLKKDGKNFSKKADYFDRQYIFNFSKNFEKDLISCLSHYESADKTFEKDEIEQEMER